MPSKSLIACSFLVALGGAFNFGLQLVLTDPAESAFIEFEKESVKNHFTTELEKDLLKDIWSVTVALFFVGGLQLIP